MTRPHSFKGLLRWCGRGLKVRIGFYFRLWVGRYIDVIYITIVISDVLSVCVGGRTQPFGVN